jgi:Peptidase C13 family
VQRDGTAAPQAFFLGFAGVGDQKVFAQEIGLAARVLGERFSIGDRRLSLINDQRDLRRAPLASVTALNYALQGIAERMDPDKDVLFLAISSHGSEDPSIAVSNSQFPLTSLTAEDLEKALRESGIRWRVILISACYAGGFIDALRDPKTIVITAAAKDRTSFGCSNDSDLTYFGEAFYRDALPGAKSLRDAFGAAKSAIAAREHREHETPSNPQAYFGAEIEAKLKVMGSP